MWRLNITILIIACWCNLQAQTPGFYFGPRFAMGQAQFTGLQGFRDGASVQLGVSSNKQFTPSFALEFMPYIGLYNGQRRIGEGDGVYPNGTRKFLYYNDKYNIYSVEFPVYAKFTGGFRRVNLGLYGGPSLGFLMAGTRSKQYDDPTFNAEHGYSGHAMEDLRNGMYSGDFGVSAELKATRGIVAIDFRYHHNFSPLGSLENQYFSANTKTVGLAWMFDAQ